MKNYNSSKNQDIKRQFVEREVYANVGTMTEYILNKSYDDSEAPFSWDDVENYYIDNSEKIAEIEEKREEEITESEELLENEEISEFTHDRNLEQINEKYDNQIEELQNEQEEPQEIFEWYLVFNFLCNKLAEKGEPVLMDEGIWGRTCTGQAILLDHVISEICEDMEILEGQK